jgi:hypothetical protein
MNHLHELDKLRNNVSYCEWLFDISTASNARKRLEMVKNARQDLKEFKAKATKN